MARKENLSSIQIGKKNAKKAKQKVEGCSHLPSFFARQSLRRISVQTVCRHPRDRHFFVNHLAFEAPPLWTTTLTVLLCFSSI